MKQETEAFVCLRGICCWLDQLASCVPQLELPRTPAKAFSFPSSPFAIQEKQKSSRTPARNLNRNFGWQARLRLTDALRFPSMMPGKDAQGVCTKGRFTYLVERVKVRTIDRDIARIRCDQMSPS